MDILKKDNFKIWLVRFLFCISIIIIYYTILNVRVIFDFFTNILKILKPFMVGGIISFLFYPICKKVEELLIKTNNPFICKRVRGIATAIVVIFSILIIASFFIKIVPKFYEAILKFAEDMSYSFSDSYLKLEEEFKDSEFVSGLLNELENQFSFDNLTKVVATLDFKDFKIYFGSIANIIFAIFKFFISFIISIYILLERYNIKKAILRLFNVTLKKGTVKQIKRFWRKGQTIIYTFIFGQSIDAFIVGCSLGVVLSILRVKNSVVLAFIYFVLAIIPYFGSITAVILIALFTYVGGDVNKFFTVLVVSLIFQQVDSNIINPKIVGQVVGIRPLYVILGITLFGGMFGVIGFFLGPPIMVICLEFLDDLIKAREVKKKIRNMNKERTEKF